MLTFLTPSPFDLTSLTTFGLSAKPAAPNASPIGYFGTGLKYAIATCLRHGCKVSIQTPDESYALVVGEIDFRGTPHSRLYLDATPGVTAERIALPFTLDLGKNWTPLMAYRELESNTRDEQGVTLASAEALAAYRRQHDTSTSTLITVSGEAIDEAYAQRDLIFLSPSFHGKPLWTSPSLEVYRAPAGTRSQVFYRGVSVLRDAGEATPYIYNLLDEVRLTEDRTLDYYSAAFRIADHTWGNPDFPFSLLSRIAKLERTIDTTYADSRLHETHAEALLNAFESGEAFPLSLISTARIKTGRKFRPHLVEIDATYQVQLDEALSILQKNGIKITAPIFILEPHEQFTGLATHDEKAIYLTTEAFARGQIYLIGTLFEEWTHISTGLRDESRALQEYLIDKIARLFYLSARKSHA
jgi:hypothetical protein